MDAEQLDEIQKAARLSVKQMQSHLDELAVETGGRLETWEGLPTTPARLVLGGDSPVIYNKPLRSRYQYLGGLHEFGHYFCAHEGRLFGPHPVHLVEEAEAWVWAFDHSRVEITTAFKCRVASTLTGYVLDVGADLHDYGMSSVPDEMRDRYASDLERLIPTLDELRNPVRWDDAKSGP